MIFDDLPNSSTRNSLFPYGPQISHSLTLLVALTVTFFSRRATASPRSVVGTRYGCTRCLTSVLCSNAYANPMRSASLHDGPRKLIPNGMFGPVSTSVPRSFRTTG